MAANAIVECLVTVVLTASNQPVMKTYQTEIFPTNNADTPAVVTTKRHSFVERLECGTYRLVVEGVERRVFTLVKGTESTIAIKMD